MKPLQGGLLMAGLVILISIIIYLAGPEAIAGSMWSGMLIGLVSIAIWIIGLCLIAVQLRKTAGGIIGFGTLYKQLLIVVVVAVFGATAFDYILHGLIDPSFMEQARELSVDMLYEQVGDSLSDEEMDKMIERVTSQYNRSDVKAMAKNFAIGVLVWAIVSLILAAIFKKKDPEFEGIDG